MFSVSGIDGVLFHTLLTAKHQAPELLSSQFFLALSTWIFIERLAVFKTSSFYGKAEKYRISSIVSECVHLLHDRVIFKSCVVSVLVVNKIRYDPCVVFASVRLPLYTNTQDTLGKMRRRGIV